MPNIVKFGGGNEKAISHGYCAYNRQNDLTVNTVLIPEIHDGTKITVATQMSFRFYVYNAGNITSISSTTGTLLTKYDENGNYLGDSGSWVGSYDITGSTHITG